MATASHPAIAVLASSRYRAEAIAFSISAHTDQNIFPLTQSESSGLSNFSTVLVQLDLNLESTLELVQHANTQCPDATVVVLGLAESTESIVRLAEAGASGYVPANASFAEMLSIVQSARKGEFACTSDVTYALFSRLAELARSEDINCSQALGI